MPSAAKPRQLVPVPRQILLLAQDDVARPVELIDARHHREHDGDVAAVRRLQKRAHLRAQEARPIEPDADRPPAERRVFLLDRPLIGQDLVSADIERAEDHREVARRAQHGIVEPSLLRRRRQALGDHELQLGAEEPDALRSGLLDMRQIDRETGVQREHDLDAVARDRGDILELAVLLLAPGAQARLLAIGGLDIGLRAQVHFARAVDDDRIAIVGEPDDAFDLADRRDAERARHDRHMARRARPPRARGRASANGRSRGGRPAPCCAPRRWRSPAGPWRASHRHPRRAPRERGWQDRRGHAGARAGKDRSGASSGRACRTAPARQRLRP